MTISPASFLVSEKADSITSFLFRSENKSQNVRHREVKQVQLLGVNMPGGVKDKMGQWKPRYAESKTSRKSRPSLPSQKTQGLYPSNCPEIFDQKPI